MPPNNSKANYKTYEAQARMVRAIVAAHPEVKWNYKEIVNCYGSDLTENALNHRFRRLKALNVIIREAREQNLDLVNLTCEENKLPNAQDKVDVKNIAKYFGQSSADGIQFQFRAIKADAQAMKKAVNTGQDPVKAIDLTTPSTRTPGGKSARVTKTPASRKGRGGRSVTSQRFDGSDADDDEEDEEDDYSPTEGREASPAKRPKTEPVPVQMRDLPRAPLSEARPSANARSLPVMTASTAPVKSSASLFGTVAPRPSHFEVPMEASRMAFNDNSVDAFVGKQDAEASFYDPNDTFSGEI